MSWRTTQAGLLATGLGALVVAPWTQGDLLLLDWVSGPRGLVAQGTAPPGMPLHIVLTLLPAPVAAWLAVLAYFPLAGSGAAAMVGGSRWRRYAAALFMVCNPVVIDRIRVGHVAFLLGLATLPWLVASLRASRNRGLMRAVRPAAWCALAVAMCASTGWLVVLVVLVAGLLPRPRWRDALRCLLVLAAGGAVAVYPLVLRLTGGPGAAVPVDAYPTRGGVWGVLSLQGFWRTNAQDATLAWFSILMVAAVVAGFWQLWRSDRDFFWPASVMAAIGVLWAPGGLPPRVVEAQQWIGLALVGYTAAFAFGAEWAALRMRARVPVVSAAIVATPLVLVPALVWGAGIPASQYPLGWYGAELVMGPGQGAVMFLPWHAYQPFGFTGDRAVATPAATLFRRPVLSNDAVELPAVRTASASRRTAYVTRLLADGGGGNFGQLVAPLGVEFVAVSQGPSADAYSWLDDDPSLQQVLATESMVVYRVLAQGTGRVQGRRMAGYDDLLASSAELGTEAVTPEGAEVAPVPSDAAGGLRRTSPHSWQVAAGTPGWVVVPEEYDPGWQGAQPTTAGTLALEVGPEATEITFQPWRLRLLAQVLALLALLVLAVVAAGASIREVAERRRARSAPASGSPQTVPSEPVDR